MNLILLDSSELDPRSEVLLTDHRADHIRTVLRSEPDQILRVGLLNGLIGRGRILRADGDGVRLSCRFDREAPPAPRVDLLLALPRPKAMKRLWPALAALGVGRILVTQASRVERSYFDSHALDPAFIEFRLREGLEQAGDTRLPEVTLHRQWDKLLEEDLDRLCPAGDRWLAHPAADRRVADLPPPENRLLLAIGPEGGWSARELESLCARGFIPFTAGSRIWRTEWAAVALTAIVRDRMESADASHPPTDGSPASLPR